jgi:hypothetical protein
LSAVRIAVASRTTLVAEMVLRRRDSSNHGGAVAF